MNFDVADEFCRRQYNEFEKLLNEPSCNAPSVNSRVLVAAGLLGMGFPWIREEAVVLECGDTSYKVKFINYRFSRNEDIIMWVHQTLITDVLGEVDARKS